MWLPLLVAVLVLTLSGCVGIVFSDHPPDQTVANTLVGEECITQFLFITAGNATVEGAMKAGGITKVYKVEHTQDFFLIAGTICTKVYGEGTGPKPVSGNPQLR